MQAFHNDPAIKAKYVERMRAHIAADELVRGLTGQDGKGCAVWCTLDTYYHSAFKEEIGPKWLAYLMDTLFENMSIEKSKTWPLEFLEAIRPGADLDKIKGPFLIFVLESALKTFDHAAFPDVKAAINGSIALWRRDDVRTDEWQSARSAPKAAAKAAAWAAWAAAWAMAWAEESVAWAMAWAEESVAEESVAEESVAESAFDHFADELLRLMREAK